MIAGGVGLVLLLGLAGVFYFVFRLTAPMVEEGEKFLAKLGSGSTGGAYEMASTTLRSSQSKDDFALAVGAYGLDGFDSATWSSRSIVNDRGKLEGTARTKSGGSVPLTLEMIKEDGTWKVLSIKGPQAGASTGTIIGDEPAVSAGPALPDAAAASALTLASLTAFNEAVQTRAFETFHSGLATLWKDQTTPAELLEKFQSYIDSGVDISPIQEMEPVFTSPPALDDDGFLKLDGYYPTEPKKVHFSLLYGSERKDWKLVGITVRVR